MEASNSNNRSLLIVHNTMIFTRGPQSRVFRNGAIIIDDDRIILSECSPLAHQIVDPHGHFLLPGLINTHVHTSQQLARGIANICISLGTDGAPSNNRMSIVDEMYLASLINKGREVYVKGTTNPTAPPAETILNKVTVNGAKSVLWDNGIGSLEIGKRVDMIIVNPFSWPMVHVHDSIASLVYCMRSGNILSVMCNGRWIMKDQKILSVDKGEVISMAKHASSQLLKSAAESCGLGCNFQFQRLMETMQVLGNEICYRAKDYLTIHKLLATRADLYKNSLLVQT